MAFIKQVSELPKWFDLKNYTSSYHQLNAETTFRGLILRKALLRGIGKPNTKLEVKDLGFYDPWPQIHNILLDKNLHLPPQLNNYLKNLTEIFYKIMLAPLKMYTWMETAKNLDNSFWYHSATSAENEYWEKAIHSKPIKSISILDIGKHFYSLPMPLRFFLRTKYLSSTHHSDYLNDSDIFNPNYEDLINRFKSLIETEFHEEESPNFSLEGIKLCLLLDNLCEMEFYNFLSSYTQPCLDNPLLEIDLNCSDNLLTEQFQIWLKNTRKQTNFKKNQNNSSQTTIGKIKTYQIFAFIDLYIWSLLTNNKIQNCVYIDALYPHGAFDDSHINKSLIPFVNKLLDPKSQEISNLIIEINKK